jgi:hypothetical protein
MFLVVNASGKYWDGFGWNEQGKEFCTQARATRSLYEQGEDLENNLIVSAEFCEVGSK